MNVYTYFVPVPLIDQTQQRKLLEWWKFTWSECGWNPVVLSIQHAQSHPRWAWYQEAMSRKPLMNSPDYELACYYRWLAVAAVGGGVQSDYDCMNNWLTPSDVASSMADGKMTIYEPKHVPSLVSGSASEFERMAELFAGFEVSQYKAEMLAETRGGTVTSDMFILSNFPEQIRPQKVVWEYRKERGWQDAKAIHFSNWACEGIGKEKAISLWIK